MPVFTNPISSQNTASQGGVSGYPKQGQCTAGSVIIDEFNRTSVNPTGIPSLYTLTNGSTGSISIYLGSQLELATAATQNDTEDCSMTGLGMIQQSNYVDPTRSTVTLDIIFVVAANAANSIGSLSFDTSSPITSPSTTATHMGIRWTAGGNFLLSSGNGSSEVTTDSGNAVDAGAYRLNVVWNGNNSAIINLYSSTNSYTSLIKSQTVTSLNFSSGNATTLKFFIKANTNTITKLHVAEWKIQVS